MKYSKFVLFAITLMLIAGGISSCGNSASDEIKKVIETANDQCPVIYETGVVTGFDVDEDNKMIVVNYEIDDEKYKISTIKEDKSKLENICRLLFLENVSQADKNLVNTIVNLGYGIRYVFKCFKSQEKIAVNFSKERLSTNKPLTIEENVKTNVDFAKLSLPLMLDSVTNMVDVDIVKDTLFYIYEVDEKLCPMSTLENKVKDNITFGISEQFRNNSSAGEFFKNVCKSGRGLCYRYKGNTTGKIVDINYDNTKLRQMANAVN